MDFFPGRSLVRVDDLKATMQMAQAFPNVWLPRSIEMNFGMMLAVGAVDATYQRRLPQLQGSRRYLQDQMRFKGSGVQGFKSSLVDSPALVLLVPFAAGAQTSPGVVGEVRVHGNHTTPDTDILGIVGEVVGKPATDELIAEVTSKLERSGRFDGVEVRKRFRSIENPDDILLMIVVDEVPAIDSQDLTPSPMKKFWSSGMFMPILHSEDGYGLTYGMRTSFVDLLGPRSRITVPLTWGGERQARVQLERAFRSGPIERLAGEFGIMRRENPHYEIGDTARRLRRSRRIRAGAMASARRRGASDDVEFGDVRIGSRASAAMSRSTHASIRRFRATPFTRRSESIALTFDAGDSDQKNADVRGYVGFRPGRYSPCAA